MDPEDVDGAASTLAAITALVASSSPACGRVTVVAVDGPSGSGKSTIAAALGAHLHAPVVHVDDIYPGWDGLAEAVLLVTSQVLEPLARGEHAAYRRWDWMRSRWGATVPVPPTDLLVLEGVGSSVRPAGDLAAVRVWVEADRDTRFARGMARDGETYRPHWERWARQEADLFAADGTRDRAHLVIDTTPA